ncbi:hypothetical protein VTK26DRAFT_2327 [Humicola hyalothermophila]
MTSTGSTAHGAGTVAKCDVSPFSSDIVTFKFKDGPPLTIHRKILERSPEFAGICDGLQPDYMYVNDRWVSANAGHAVINYLYTGSLGVLEPADSDLPPAKSREAVQLGAVFDVYAVSGRYEIKGLHELARAEIERLAANTDVFTLIDIVKETCPTGIGNDHWLHRYLKSRVKAAFQNPSALLQAKYLPDYQDAGSFVKLFLGCILEAYADLLEALKTEPLTPRTDQSFQEVEEALFENGKEGCAEGNHRPDSVADRDEGARSHVDEVFEMAPESEHPAATPVRRRKSEDLIRELSAEVSMARAHIDKLPLGSAVDSKPVPAQEHMQLPEAMPAEPGSEAERKREPEPVPEPESEPGPFPKDSNSEPKPAEPEECSLAMFPEPVPEPVPEPAPAVDEDGSLTATSKKVNKKKKKKGKISTITTTQLPTPEPDVPPLDEIPCDAIDAGLKPSPFDETTFHTRFEEGPQPQAGDEPIRDPWGFWGVSTKRRSASGTWSSGWA